MPNKEKGILLTHTQTEMTAQVLITEQYPYNPQSIRVKPERIGDRRNLRQYTDGVTVRLTLTNLRS